VSDSTLTILDVGHGSCVVLSSENELSLIDTGAGATLLEHLRSLSRTTVRRVLVSHADRDHVGSLLNLLSDDLFTVDEVWLNSDAFKGSTLWTSLTYELDEQDRAAKTSVELGIREGRSFTTGPFQVDVLAPRVRLAGLGAGSHDLEGRRLESNSLSIVCRVSVDGQPLALLPGDLDETGLAHLLDQTPTPDLRAPFVIFPHHGGHVARASNSDSNALFAERFTKLVSPDTVIFSIGRGQHGTPRLEIVNAVKSVVPGVNILCTELSRLCSAESVTSGRATHLISTTARGRNDGACCAGSIVIDRDTGVWRVRPTRAAHQAFISANALTALCRSSNKGSNTDRPQVGPATASPGEPA
jgi:beta-lactamase superfamily II metal-dependent hydrolase